MDSQKEGFWANDTINVIGITIPSIIIFISYLRRSRKNLKSDKNTDHEDVKLGFSNFHAPDLH